MGIAAKDKNRFGRITFLEYVEPRLKVQRPSLAQRLFAHALAALNPELIQGLAQRALA